MDKTQKENKEEAVNILNGLRSTVTMNRYAALGFLTREKQTYQPDLDLNIGDKELIALAGKVLDDKISTINAS